MVTKLEKIRAKLNKALDIYPFDSEIVQKLSRELDQLIYKSYVRTETSWRLRQK